MRLPVELEHLIKTAAPSSTLSASLQLIEARRNLEAEHYLRACAIRLDLDEPCAAHDGGV